MSLFIEFVLFLHYCSFSAACTHFVSFLFVDYEACVLVLSIVHSENTLTRNILILMDCRFVSDIRRFFLFFCFYYIRHLIIILNEV